MKKIIQIVIVLMLAFLTSCGKNDPSTYITGTINAETTSSEKTPSEMSKSSADEVPTKRVFTSQNDNFLLETTINGYKSESLKLDFYVKNTEVVEVTSKVTNISGNHDTVFYYWDDCMNSDSHTRTTHNHTFSYHWAEKSGKCLNSYYSPPIHMAQYLNFALEKGESHERTSFFIVGELSNDCDVELTDYKWSNLIWDYKGIKAYDGIYIDGKCEFLGTVGFFCNSFKAEKGTVSDTGITCDLFITVIDCR